MGGGGVGGKERDDRDKGSPEKAVDVYGRTYRNPPPPSSPPHTQPSNGKWRGFGIPELNLGIVLCQMRV